MQKRQGWTIARKIYAGAALAFLLALLSIYLVVEQKVKPALIQERQAMIQASQQDMLGLLGAKLAQIQQLTASLASQSQLLPKDEALFKRLFPVVIDNHGDATIAGGGIWPEPDSFTPGVARRSFFWGRDNGELKYLDDYNDPQGSGYHNESWYQVGRQGQAGQCSWSEAYTDPYSKTPMITCTVPMLSQGRFMGVSTVDMMLDGITALLQRYGQSQGGYAFAIDQSGQIISFPGDLAKPAADGSMVRLAQLTQQQPWLVPLAQQIAGLAGGDRLLDLADDGVLHEPVLVSLSRLPQTGWTLGLVVPKAHMTAVARQMGLFLLLTVGATLAVMLVLGLLFFRGILDTLARTTSQIRALASGSADLNERLTILRQDEVGELRQAVNDYADRLKQLLQRVQEAANALLGEASELNRFSTGFMQKAQELRDENTMLATGAHEMGATAQEVARHAHDTQTTVSQLHEEVKHSGHEMSDVIITMQRLAGVIHQAQQSIVQLEQDSGQVSGMLEVIRGIADQTNLLALNAAIEAARAGESGRGFAVVADEVRSLAAKSQQSAVEIEQVIARLQATSRQSVSAMSQGQVETDKAVSGAQQTHEHLQAVVEAFGQITERATQIAVAAEEQERVTQEMSLQLSNLNQLTDGNADNSAKLNRMSDTLAEVAGQLTRLS
ncbi:methyl-accepting chemotaxis protein [Pseudaeromonas sp. ZJS20]|uniref:methyl-accepting chemotaxis protein n=1 Tax=Pseudaeromonas aegiceratis TaxID=3153928 RepID=UPI00390CD88A